MAEQSELNPHALSVAHALVEDVLIEFRDSGLSMLTAANGFVVRSRDRTPSSLIRLGTREGLDIGIRAYQDAVAAGVDSPQSAQAFVDARRAQDD
jgi:hypothetical protein